MSLTFASSADGLSGAIQIGGVSKVNITNSGLQFTKNKLINGEVTRINQRVFNGAWAGKSVWETQPATIAGKEAAYGYDMWFRSNAARSDGTGASENMAQWIESGNYRPSTVHTLSGTGVTTTSITSPASGDWKIVVAQGATNVQVEEGTVATPFELRSIRYELAECQRHCYILSGFPLGYAMTAGLPGGAVIFVVTMRTIPDISGLTFVVGSGSVGVAANSGNTSSQGFSVANSSANWTPGVWVKISGTASAVI